MYDPLSPATAVAGVPNQQPGQTGGHALLNFGLGLNPAVQRLRQHIMQPRPQAPDLMAMALYGPQAMQAKGGGRAHP